MAIPPHRPRPQGPRPHRHEMEALKKIKLGLPVEPAMHNRLTEAGLIQQVSGATVLTENGLSWEAAG